MAVRIRLTRVGTTKRPAYRVVAIDRQRARDGRALEILGYYDPLTEPATVKLDADRINAWIGNGALPSDTVVRLMRQAGMLPARESAEPSPKRRTSARRGRGAAATAREAGSEA